MIIKKLACILTAAFCLLASIPNGGFSASAYDAEVLKERILTALESYDDYVDTSDYEITLQESFNIFKAVIYENPQLYYVKRQIEGNSYGFKLAYNYDADEVKLMQQQVDEEKARLLSHVSEDMTDAQKVCAVHNYIVFTYDYNVAETLELCDFNLYGLMVNKTGVCQAYAETFLYIMQELGIEAKFVEGVANGGGHAWNCVKIDGVWYQLDSTWDDAIVDFTDHYVCYDYFLISDEAMSAEHEYEKSDYPACNKNYEDLDSLLFMRENGVKYSFDKTIMYDYPSGLLDTYFEVPDTVYAIVDADSSWFNGILEEVYIPESVEHISRRAFSSCRQLKTIYGVMGSEAERFAAENGYEFIEKSKALNGDVDGNGIINPNDALSILEVCAELTELDEAQTARADMNGDGNITALDAYLVLMLDAEAA